MIRALTSLVQISYYKRKLAVCRLISFFYRTLLSTHLARTHVVGSYKYYTCVVFRSSHLVNSSLLSFHFFIIIQNVKQDEHRKQNGNSFPAFD